MTGETYQLNLLSFDVQSLKDTSFYLVACYM
jgi:hypothetical protein